MTEPKPTRAKASQQTLTKEQVIDGINKYIESNHDKEPKTVVDGIRAFVDASGVDAVQKALGVSHIYKFYHELSKLHVRLEQELLALARATNPYFINDTTAFMKYINRDWEKTQYSCNVFKQDGADHVATPVAFPNGTLSYIGARTHRGKTTAMISIAADALNQGKTVYIYTNEESPEQIIARLIKARLFYNLCPYYDGTDEDVEPLNNIVPAGVNLNTIMNAALKGNGNGSPLHKHIQQAFLDVNDDLHKGNLNIINGVAQRSFDDIVASLEMLKSGDVVLLDYIQHIRKPAATQAYLQIQQASQTIADTAVLKDLVIIAGAQLNRDAENDDDDTDNEKKVQKPDKLGAQYFRESGDIEQDANIIIQIGQQAHPDTDRDPTRFYKILKQRNHAGDEHRYLIDDNARFSLYGCKCTGGMLDYFRPEKPDTKGTDKTDKPKFIIPKA